LTFRKIVHAAVVGVVHVIGDGIGSIARAGIAASGASRGRASFRGGIIHQIPVSTAATLKSVVQAQPVPDFVRQGIATVEGGSVASWHGIVEENHAIIVSKGALRERCIPKKAITEAARVNVKSIHTTLAKSAFHVPIVIIIATSRRGVKIAVCHSPHNNVKIKH
jgi:hypothetical protein